MKKILLIDKRIIDSLKASEVDYDVAGYDPEKTFRDNGIDSLDVMGLFLTIEETYGIKFSAEEANLIRTPSGISAALDSKLSRD